MKILEKNGIDNTNIDGAGFNRFCAGDRDGIIKGRLNECAIAAQGNTLTIGTGEMLVSGFRVVLDTPTTFTMSSTPTVAQRYQVIAEIVVDGNSEPTFSLRTQLVAELKQDALFATEAGVGTYQVEVCRFTHATSGNIDDLLRTIDVITGGSGTGGGGSAELEIGTVTTETLDAGMEAEVNINIDNNVLSAKFGIPRGADGQGMPSGGTTGQILKKVDDKDYNAEWADLDESGKLPSGGTAGQVLTKVDESNYNAEWKDIPESGVKKNEIIERAESIPTAVADSADFVGVEKQLYRKARYFESNPILLDETYTMPVSSSVVRSVYYNGIAYVFVDTKMYEFDCSTKTFSDNVLELPFSITDNYPMIEDGKIYFATEDRNLYQIDTETKEISIIKTSINTSVVARPCTMHNKTIYAFSQHQTGLNYYVDMDTYNFETDAITSKNCGRGKFSDGVCVYHNGYVYVCSRPDDSNFRINTTNNEKEEITNFLKTAGLYSECGYTVLGNNIFAIGGRYSSSIPGSKKAVLYNVDDDSYKYFTPLSYGLINCGCVAHGKSVFVFGGYNTDSKTATPTVYQIAVGADVYKYFPVGTDKYADLNGKPKLNTSNTTAQTTSEAEEINGTVNLHKVSKTGSYNDLNDKPTIPEKTSEIENDSNFYAKPTDGIPETDLAAEIIAKLNRTIPTKTSDLENDSAFYAKPESGIPESDLSEEAQTKLNSSYTLPVATPNTLGGVKPETKTAEMTQTVGVDEDGKLWTKKETVTSVNGKTGDVVIGLDDIGGLNEELESLATDEDLIAEKSARQSADTALQGNIDAEATARENADTTLQNNITAEASARQSADNNLQTQITANTNALGTKADTTALTAETQARQNADNGLQQQVTAAQAKADTSVQYVAQTLNQSQREQALINLGIANRPDAQGILNTLNAYNNMYVGADSTAGARLYLQGQEFAATSPVYVNQDTAAWEAFATSFDWATYGSDVSGTYYFSAFSVLSSAGGGERGGITLAKNQSTGAISAAFIGGGNITTFATYTTTGGWTISATSLSFSWAYIVSEVIAQDAWYQLFGQSVNFSAVKKPSGGGGGGGDTPAIEQETVSLTGLSVHNFIQKLFNSDDGILKTNTTKVVSAYLSGEGTTILLAEKNNTSNTQYGMFFGTPIISSTFIMWQLQIGESGVGWLMINPDGAGVYKSDGTVLSLDLNSSLFDGGELTFNILANGSGGGTGTGGSAEPVLLWSGQYKGGSSTLNVPNISGGSAEPVLLWSGSWDGTTPLTLSNANKYASIMLDIEALGKATGLLCPCKDYNTFTGSGFLVDIVSIVHTEDLTRSWVTLPITTTGLGMAVGMSVKLGTNGLSGYGYVGFNPVGNLSPFNVTAIYGLMPLTA